MPDLAFHPARDLDVYPIPLVRVAPPYPEEAKRARIAGAVTLLVLVDEFGRVSAVNVLDARPEGVFDAAAKDAYAAAVFSPASRHGHAVRSRLVIQVDFDPGGGED
jgi:protein TonB